MQKTIYAVTVEKNGWSVLRPDGAGLADIFKAEKLKTDDLKIFRLNLSEAWNGKALMPFFETTKQPGKTCLVAIVEAATMIDLSDGCGAKYFAMAAHDCGSSVAYVGMKSDVDIESSLETLTGMDFVVVQLKSIHDEFIKHADVVVVAADTGETIIEATEQSPVVEVFQSEKSRRSATRAANQIVAEMDIKELNRATRECL